MHSKVKDTDTSGCAEATQADSGDEKLIIKVMRALKLLDATIYSSLLSFNFYHNISSSAPYWIMQLLTFLAMAWDAVGVYALVLHSRGDSCDARTALNLLWAVVLSSTLALLKRFLGLAAGVLVRLPRPPVRWQPRPLIRSHIFTERFDSISTDHLWLDPS